MTDEIKYCEDCKYFQKDRALPDHIEYSGCSHPKTDLRNLVARRFGGCHCTIARLDGPHATCGPQARYFEAAPPRAALGSVTLTRGNPYDRGKWLSRFWDWLT